MQSSRVQTNQYFSNQVDRNSRSPKYKETVFEISSTDVDCGVPSLSGPLTAFGLLKEIHNSVPKKRSILILNAARKLAAEQFESADFQLGGNETVPAQNIDAAREKRVARRQRFVILQGIAAHASADTGAYPIAPEKPKAMSAEADTKPVVSSAAGPQSNKGLLLKLNSKAHMFPSIGKAEKSSSPQLATDSSRLEDNSSTYQKELYSVLHTIIVMLKPMAVNSDDKMLMKNLSYITLSTAPINTKLEAMITEVKKSNAAYYSNMQKRFHTEASLNMIVGFAKLVVSMNLAKEDEKLLSQLKKLTPAPVGEFPQLNRSA